jgi:ribonuclease P protein component
LKPIPLTRRQIQNLVSSPEIKYVSPYFILLCRSSSEQRLSILAGKKLGNAVRRNRIRRRLKEAFRLTEGFPVGEYAILGLALSLIASFQALTEQMREAQMRLSKLKA